jgi:hypothetical protein
LSSSATGIHHAARVDDRYRSRGDEGVSNADFCRHEPRCKEMTVSLQVSAILLGVKDVDRATKFCAEGLGCEIEQDFPGFSMLALYQWEAAAQDEFRLNV